MSNEISLQISDRVKELAAQAQRDVEPYFSRIDAIAEENTRKVLGAFQKHRVADGYFAGTTGYGYDDLGRDQLDAIYADIFGTIPIAEALLAKGARLGVVLAFMMAVTTLSLPSMVMLRRAVKPKLLWLFIGICTIGILLVGHLFNLAQVFLLTP